MLNKLRAFFTFSGGFLFGAWIIVMGFFAYLHFSEARVEYSSIGASRPTDLILKYDTWRTYANVTQDYDLQYPLNWHVQEFALFIGNNAVISDTVVPTNVRLPESPWEVARGFILDIYIRKTEGQTDPEKWIKNNLKSFDPDATIETMEKIEVSGENARLVTLAVEAPEEVLPNARGTYEVVVLPYKNDTYIMRLFTGAEEQAMYRQVFTQMLATFRFRDEVKAEPWAKYKNAKYGFTLQYPADWAKEEPDANTFKVSKKFAADNTTAGIEERAEFSVQVFNFPAGTNLENWVKQHDDYKKRGLRLGDQDEGPSYVKGTRAIKRFYINPKEPGRFVTVFAPYRNKLYRVEYNFVFDESRVKRKATYERILYDILNSVGVK